MRTLVVLCIAPIAFGLAAFGQAASSPARSNPAASNPASPGFDPSAIDPSANPCVDFYHYACGAWMAANPIPPDQSRWGRFDVLQERNREVLRKILEQAANPQAKRSGIEQKMGDYYASCMDESAINAKGIAPLKPELDRIAAVKDKAGLVDAVAGLYQLGAAPFFRFGSSPDAKNSSMMIADLDQGGLGLPDRDYYLKTDDKSVTLRKEYAAHIQRMLELAGTRPEDAAKQAQAIMAIETDLAMGSLDRVSRRDPEKLYHKLPVKDLGTASSDFGWARFFQQVGAPRFNELNVDVPDFVKAVNQVVAKYSLDDLKTYLVWNLLRDSADSLSAPFVDEHFNFYGKTLRGTKELPARWKRCVEAADSQLPDAVGKKFVETTLGPEGVRRTQQMVVEIEKAMGEDLKSLDWMTAKTKQQAEEKLHAIMNKIGTNAKWQTYSTVKITRDDFLGNTERASAFEVHRQLAKIGKPVDKQEWQMSQPTVNAYYDPQQNNINFPAGILQPPFYDNKASDAVNYGAIGAVVGHELTHAFDDEGRQFDAKGNLRDWWTPEDAKAFEERAQCFVKEYDGFTAIDDVHVNGKLTLGENTADNGGLRLAYMALMDKLGGRQAAANNGAANGGAAKQGFTPEQQFFLGWGQIWCSNVRPETARLRAQTDPHSPPRERVNGVVSNMPEFQKAFACMAGQPMVRNPACRVW
jgi:putative endopeptidase